MNWPAPLPGSKVPREGCATIAYVNASPSGSVAASVTATGTSSGVETETGGAAGAAFGILLIASAVAIAPWAGAWLLFATQRTVVTSPVRSPKGTLIFSELPGTIV